MKTDREVVTGSRYLTSSGRMIADRIMRDHGVSIEELCNIIGRLEDRIDELESSHD